MRNRDGSSYAPTFASRLGKYFVIIATTLLILMVVDISLVKLYDLVNKEFIPVAYKEILFSTITIACFVAQYFLLQISNPSQTDVTKDRLNSKQIYKITKGVQYALCALVAVIILQIQLVSYYSTSLVMIVILCSYTLCMIILIKFLTRILKWISSKRSMIVPTLFVCALGGVMLNAAFAIIDTSLRLEYRPDETKLILGGSVDVSKGKFDSLDFAYYISYLFSFVIAWVATASLLVFYSDRIGKMKFWLITLMPLFFFLGQYSSFFAMYMSPLFNLDPFFLADLTTLIITLSKPLGGLMLGIAFWIMGRVGGGNNIQVRNYLYISGFGMLLLFTSNQAMLMTISPYPPFGLATIAMFGFSAYLTMIGIYSSSVVVSHSAELRKSIQRLASSKFLNSLAYAEMESQLEATVLELAKKQSLETENQTGISSTLTDIDAKKYLEEVLDEIKGRSAH